MNRSDIKKYDSDYLPGIHNRGIRYYFYLTKGLDILNQSRNLFLAIFALYFALKLDNPLWLILMGIASTLLLTAMGYYSVHKVSKLTEWLNLRFSTHYGLRQFDYIEKQYEVLKEIREQLKNNP